MPRSRAKWSPYAVHTNIIDKVNCNDVNIFFKTCDLRFLVFNFVRRPLGGGGGGAGGGGGGGGGEEEEEDPSPS